MQGNSSDSPDGANSARRLAFMRAFDTHADFFYGYFHRKTGNPDLADDLSQDFWVNVYKNFATHQFSHVRLLQRQALQIFLQELRRRGDRSFVELSDELPQLVTSPEPQEPTNQAEEAALKTRFWEQFHGIDLTEKQKDVFWLKARYGYNVTEIATKYGLPTSTVQDWIKKVKESCAAVFKSN